MIDAMPTVFVFCALPCEAKHLIQNWKLSKRNTSSPFSVYVNRDSPHAVIVTGVGKIAMASALGYTMALLETPQLPILLNFGIAGHANLPVGSAHIADKILDTETHRHFYPALPFSLPCPSTTLMTRTAPETFYAKDCLYDMEGSAFYEAASKFSSTEFIHCLKVISDNHQSPISHIDETKVSQWCGEQSLTLQKLIDELQTLKTALPTLSLEEYEPITAHFHLSATNSAKLKKLLLRWQVLHQERKLAWQNAGCRSGKELLTWIEGQLEGKFYL